MYYDFRPQLPAAIEGVYNTRAQLSFQYLIMGKLLIKGKQE